MPTFMLLDYRQGKKVNDLLIITLNYFCTSCILKQLEVWGSVLRNSPILHPLSNFHLSVKVSIWNFFWQRILKENPNQILTLTDLDNCYCGSFPSTNHSFPLHDKMYLIESAFCLREIQSEFTQTVSVILNKSLFKTLFCRGLQAAAYWDMFFFWTWWLINLIKEGKSH